MAVDLKRIYTPITKNLCVSTPYAQVDGKKSYLPMAKGKVDAQLIDDVKKAGGIVDNDYSIVAGEKGHEEHGQLELTLSFKPDVPAVYEGDGVTIKIPATVYPAKVLAKLGVDGSSMGIFPSPTDIDAALVIGGTYGANTLKIIAALAKEGTYLRINGMHIDADDNKHFTAKMIERQYKHDGSSAGDKNILYPKAMATSEQTTIRTIESMELFLDGFGFLEIPIYKGVEANITLDTTYVR